MRTRKMEIIIIVCVVIVVATGFGGKYLFDVIQYKKEISRIEICNIEMSRIEDGLYKGEYDVNFISAKVEVEVKDNKIVTIRLLEHKNDRGKAAEKIIDEVIAKNSIKVDTISGATNSSKVILEAIRDAMEG